MAKINKIDNTHFGNFMNQLGLSYEAGGSVTWCRHSEEKLAMYPKAKMFPASRSSSFTPKYISNRNELYMQK